LSAPEGDTRARQRRRRTLAREIVDAIVEKHGPERAAVIFRNMARNYLIGVVTCQVVFWVAFFGLPRHGSFSSVFLYVGLFLLVIMAVTVIGAVRATAPLITFVAAANLLLLLLSYFSVLYYHYGTARNWSASLSHWDAVYVALGTLTTAGTGNIYAKSEFARRVLSMQMLVDVVVITLLAGVVVYRLTERASS
jgi:hypothetical protein